MANPTFSNLSDRASGTFSGLRGRLSGTGGDSRGDGYGGAGGYGGYSDGYGYDGYPDDPGGYAAGYDAPRYHRSQVGSPYDDIDDISGVGEVRTREVRGRASGIGRASGGGRYHPQLVSFDEARVNSYVPDSIVRDSRERARSRRFEHPASRYTPRRRDAVDMGRASDYDLTPPEPAPMQPGRDMGGGPDDATAAGWGAPVQGASSQQVRPAAPRAAAGAGAPDAAMPQPRMQASPQPAPGAARVPASQMAGRPVAQGARSAASGRVRQVRVFSPREYGDAEGVARALRVGDVAVLALGQTPAGLAKRLLDFSFGVASAFDAKVECPVPRVYVIARGKGLSDTERAQLKQQGIDW